jgi:hypothetical protein
MTHRQRHAIAPLLEAIRAILTIFGRAEEEAPGTWQHSSPAVHLETAQWERILDEFAEKGSCPTGDSRFHAARRPKASVHLLQKKIVVGAGRLPRRGLQPP